MKIQTLTIDWAFDDDLPEIHCPICGETADSENRRFCSHVDFVYLFQYQEFDYIADSFKEKAVKLQQKVDEKSEARKNKLNELLQNLPSTGTNFIIELKTSGMNCGPESFTVYYGFELASS